MPWRAAISISTGSSMSTVSSGVRSRSGRGVDPQLLARYDPRLYRPQGFTDQMFVAIDGRAVEGPVANRRRLHYGGSDLFPRNVVGTERSQADNGNLCPGRQCLLGDEVG